MHARAQKLQLAEGLDASREQSQQREQHKASQQLAFQVRQRSHHPQPPCMAAA